MYERGQRIVIRDQKHGDQMVIVEDIVADQDGQKLKVKDPTTHLVRVVDPCQQTVVEHLED